MDDDNQKDPETVLMPQILTHINAKDKFGNTSLI